MKKHLSRRLRYMTASVTEGDQGGTGSGGGAGATGDKTFTQAQVDAIVTSRLAREASRFADYDQLKASAEQLATLTTTYGTDIAAGITAAIEAARTEAATAAAEAARPHLVAAKAEALAAAAHLTVPSDVVALRSAELAKVGLSEDGSVDAAALQAVIDGLVAQRPDLVAKVTPGAVPGVGAGSSTTTAGSAAPGIGTLRDAYAETSTTS